MGNRFLDELAILPQPLAPPTRQTRRGPSAGGGGPSSTQAWERLALDLFAASLLVYAAWASGGGTWPGWYGLSNAAIVLKCEHVYLDGTQEAWMETSWYPLAGVVATTFEKRCGMGW